MIDRKCQVGALHVGDWIQYREMWWEIASFQPKGIQMLSMRLISRDDDNTVFAETQLTLPRKNSVLTRRMW